MGYGLNIELDCAQHIFSLRVGWLQDIGGRVEPEAGRDQRKDYFTASIHFRSPSWN
jgi:hypothetical protein